ncbi:MAG: hypothetical protein WBX25_25870 [Rhodomicrobium sp.]
MPVYDDSIEGTVLTIRKNRTPAVLRKLGKAKANTRVARRLLGSPIRFRA